MPSLQVQELDAALSLDSRCLRESIISGKEVSVDEILSLSSGTQALYLVAVLESREMAHIEDRHRAWTEVAEVFGKLCGCWAGISSDDPQIRWLVQRLEQFMELAGDQVQLYSISSRERLEYLERRADGVQTFCGRGEITPGDTPGDGYRNQSSPAHIYTIGRF